MSTLTPSRRNVMRALAAITTGLPTLAYATPSTPAAIGLTCTTVDPIPEYLGAFHAYDEDDASSVARHTAGRNALHDWVPATAEDMLRKIVAILDDHGAAPETSLSRLIQQVDRLVIDNA